MKKNYYTHKDFKNQNLTGNEKVLLDEIIVLSLNRGYCYKSNRKFAETYGVTERTIQRWINSLKQKNCIKVEISDNFNRKIYVNYSILHAKGKDDEYVTPLRQECHTPTSKVTEGDVNDDIINNNINNNTNYNTIFDEDDSSVQINNTFGSFITNINLDLIEKELNDTDLIILNAIIDVVYNMVTNMGDLYINNSKICYQSIKERLLLLDKTHIEDIINTLKGASVSNPTKYIQSLLYNAPVNAAIKHSKQQSTPSTSSYDNYVKHCGFNSKEELEAALFGHV